MLTVKSILYFVTFPVRVHVLCAKTSLPLVCCIELRHVLKLLHLIGNCSGMTVDVAYKKMPDQFSGNVCIF